jgi:hypothetical protein
VKDKEFPYSIETLDFHFITYGKGLGFVMLEKMIAGVVQTTLACTWGRARGKNWRKILE